MAIDVDSIQSFTEAELLKLYRWAFAMNAAGQTRTTNDGRTVSFPPLPELIKAIEWLEARAIADDNSGGGIVEVWFSDQSH